VALNNAVDENAQQAQNIDGEKCVADYHCGTIILQPPRPFGTPLLLEGGELALRSNIGSTRQPSPWKGGVPSSGEGVKPCKGGVAEGRGGRMQVSFAMCQRYLNRVSIILYPAPIVPFIVPETFDSPILTL